jgi:hypothetical protein
VGVDAAAGQTHDSRHDGKYNQPPDQGAHAGIIGPTAAPEGRAEYDHV